MPESTTITQPPGTPVSPTWKNWLFVMLASLLVQWQLVLVEGQQLGWGVWLITWMPDLVRVKVFVSMSVKRVTSMVMASTDVSVIELL